MRVLARLVSGHSSAKSPRAALLAEGIFVLRVGFDRLAVPFLTAMLLSLDHILVIVLVAALSRVSFLSLAFFSNWFLIFSIMADSVHSGSSSSSLSSKTLVSTEDPPSDFQLAERPGAGNELSFDRVDWAPTVLLGARGISLG